MKIGNHVMLACCPIPLVALAAIFDMIMPDIIRQSAPRRVGCVPGRLASTRRAGIQPVRS